MYLLILVKWRFSYLDRRFFIMNALAKPDRIPAWIKTSQSYPFALPSFNEDRSLMCLPDGGLWGTWRMTWAISIFNWTTRETLKYFQVLVPNAQTKVTKGLFRAFVPSLTGFIQRNSITATGFHPANLFLTKFPIVGCDLNKSADDLNKLPQSGDG